MNKDVRLKIKDFCLKSIIHYSLIINRKSKGFTLIELIVVITITAILSVGGLAAFIQYSQTQTLNNATADILGMLQLAKSRAQSQTKPTSSCDSLKGYKVIIDTTKYTLYAVCGVNEQKITNWEKTLPNNICFTTCTTATTNPIFFNAISGAVNGAGTISIKSSVFGGEKTITVSQTGVIQVGANCQPTPNCL